jgi:hypothetical protein
MTRSVLVRRLLRGRRVQAVSIALVAFALTAAMTGLLTVRSSAAQAVADATRADHGGHSFAVQVLDASVTPILAARRDLLPIWQSTGSAATPTRQVPVTVCAVAASAASPGVLLRGRRPHRAGEATVSTAVQRALGAEIGDTVAVATGGPAALARVVGITVSPDDRGDATAVLFAPGDPRDATVWVTDTDVFTDAQLRPVLERRQAKARTVSHLADDRRAAAIDTLLAALRYSAPAFALLAVCLAGIMLAAMHRERRRDVLALAAAGMSTTAGWRLLSTAAAWCSTVGAVAGATVTVAGLWLLRERVSAPLGQQWQSVAVPWAALVVYLLLLSPAALALAWVTTRGQRVSVALTRLRAPTWTGAALFTAGAAVLVLMAVRVVPVALAALAGLVTVSGACLLLVSGLTMIRRPALRRLIRGSARPLAGLALAAAVITFSAGYYTARQDHSALSVAADNVPYQPPGSLFVDGINADTRAALQRQYLALGGRRSAAYLTVAEPTQAIRATSPRMIDCLEQRGSRDPNDVLGECAPDGTMSPINTIALTDAPATAGLRADKALVERGRTGLLTFTGDSMLATAVTTEPARADPVLGGNLPAAVVGVDSLLARRLHLTPSGAQSLLLLDFADLPDAAQARMRGTIARIASTAQTGEDYDDTERQLRAVATAVTIGATAVILLVTTTVGMAFLASQRDLRRVLGHLGIDRRRRRAVGVRMLLVPVGVLAVALATARFSAWLAGVHNDSGFGWLWAVPGLAGMAACVILAAAYGTAPPATTTE